MKAFCGNIVYFPSFDKFEIFENGYIFVDEENRIVKVTKDEPMCPIVDYSDKFIIPSFTDLHVHACQFRNMGIGYDETLLEWLCKYTFPEETKYSDLDYASKIYSSFADCLLYHGSLHSVIMASLC
ncbi:hypothetical protein ACOME3_004518 [Neoechinorhynchus agilis]